MADPPKQVGQPSHLPDRADSGEPQALDQFPDNVFSSTQHQALAPGQHTTTGLFDNCSPWILGDDHVGEESFYQAIMPWLDPGSPQRNPNAPASPGHYTLGQPFENLESVIDNDWAELPPSLTVLPANTPPWNPGNVNPYAPVPPTLLSHSAPDMWQPSSGPALPSTPTGATHAQPGVWDPGSMALSCAFKGSGQGLPGQGDLLAHQNAHPALLCPHGCEKPLSSASALHRHNQTAHAKDPPMFACGCGHRTPGNRRDNHSRHLGNCNKAAVAEFVCSCNFRMPDKELHKEHFKDCKRPAGRRSGKQKSVAP